MQQSFRLQQLFLIGSLLLFTTGCFKAYEIISTEFSQARRHEPSYATINDSLRSVTLYEGFETRAHFDVLWMSDDMRSVYAALRSAKEGHSPEKRDASLVSQLEENNHWITFYVLAEVKDDAHVSLNDKNSAWSLFVTTANGARLAPESIKEVELSPEIRFCFGRRFALYKKAYRFRFKAHDLAGNRYLMPRDLFTMTCARPGMSEQVSWTVPLLQKQSVLQERYELRDKDKRGIWGTMSQMAQPAQRDEFDF